MHVDNTIYETFGHLWWSDDAGFEITSLRYSMNPVRHTYFRRELGELTLPGRRLLDVGCGGGFLAESFAKDGYEVTGLDPSAASIRAASEHAALTGLTVRYLVGAGEALPFADESFDVVACCDVLEHVADPAVVIRELARVLTAGGVLLFDTVNRTLRSKLFLIKIWQDWRLIGPVFANAHCFEKFITPDELDRALRASGLAPGRVKGIGPARHPLAFLRALWRIRAGKVRGADVGREFALRETDDLGASYMGWARKPAPPRPPPHPEAATRPLAQDL